MIVRDADFKPTTLQEVEEELFALSEKRKRCVFEKDQLLHHNRKLADRKAYVESKGNVRLLLVIPLTAALVVMTIFESSILREANVEEGGLLGYTGIAFMLCTLFLCFGVMFDIYFIFDYLHLTQCARRFPNIEQANAYCKRKGILTLQKDEYDTKNGLSALAEQIVEIDARTDALTADRERLIQEEKESKNQKKTEQDAPRSGFRLNENFYDQQYRAEAIESYTSEINVIRRIIEEYEHDLMFLRREQQQIMQDISNMKAAAIRWFFIYLAVVFVQSLCPGKLYAISAVAASVILLVSAIRLEGKMEKPVLNYLVEKDCSYISSYIFVNNITPIYKQIAEKEENMAYERDSLAKFEERVRYLEK